MNKFQFIAVAIFLYCVFSSTSPLMAQVDTIPVNTDTLLRRTTEGEVVRYDTVPPRKSKELTAPKKALLLALVLPGAGQAYNKKYWKMPILYAGVGACAYFWISNQVAYRELKAAYHRNYVAIQADETYQVYEDQLTYGTVPVYTSLAQLSTDRDTYRRYRDFSIAGSVALYALSVLDAYVDAHLKEFDLSPDLSFSIKPLFYNYNNATFAPGMSLSLRVKNNRMYNNQLYKREFLNQE
jgi:hypothetical protein